MMTIQICPHKSGDLYLAYSDDMRGLYIHGRTREEVEDRIHEAITQLREVGAAHFEGEEWITVDGPAW